MGSDSTRPTRYLLWYACIFGPELVKRRAQTDELQQAIARTVHGSCRKDMRLLDFGINPLANGTSALQVAVRIGRELERALREFVRMPTVSCDPAHREDCWRGAKFLGTLIESLGARPAFECHIRYCTGNRANALVMAIDSRSAERKLCAKACHAKMTWRSSVCCMWYRRHRSACGLWYARSMCVARTACTEAEYVVTACIQACGSCGTAYMTTGACSVCVGRCIWCVVGTWYAVCQQWCWVL